MRTEVQSEDNSQKLDREGRRCVARCGCKSWVEAPQNLLRRAGRQEAEDGEEVDEEIPPQEKEVRSRSWEQGGEGGGGGGGRRGGKGRRGRGRAVWMEVTWGHQSRWGQCPVDGPSDEGRGW